MPISSDRDYHNKRNIIEKISKKIKIGIHYPFESKSDYSYIFDKIQNAEFIIADLSFERPSCYYEIGLAQGLGAKTYLIAKQGTFIHQMQGDVRYYYDLQSYSLLFEEIVVSHWK